MRRLDWWDYYTPTVRKRAGWRCERCGERTRRLEVHHLTYERFGRELLMDLQALCEPCHKIADAERKRWTRRRYGVTCDDEDPAEMAWIIKVFGEDPSEWPTDASKRYEKWVAKQ
jgi:phage terminase large subunit GpA-like protein